MNSGRQIEQQTIVQNKMILIVGDPWSWKSFMASLLGSFYQEIYSNIKIEYFWKQISNDIRSIDDISKISFSEKKGCIILDEAWVNMNSRRFMTDENMRYWELAMLWRKLNKDIYIIAQMDYTVDKSVRNLCRYTIHMRAWYSWKNYLMFEFDVMDRSGQLVSQKQIDLFEWARQSGFSYSSLESSRIWRSTEETLDKEEILYANFGKRARKF